jgi:hypothetical protein
MSEERKFWDWFQKNEAQYFFLNQISDDDEKENLLETFLEHLHSYCDHLFFEIGGLPDEKQDLIITAEGDTDYFAQVELLINTAPLLEHWNFIDFKPARQDYTIEYNNITLDPNTLWFIPLNSNNNPQKIGIRLYADEYDETEEEDFLTASYLVLDNVLGEKSNALDIGYVEIKNLSSVSNRDDLIELGKLPKYIEWKKSKLKK